MVGRNTAWILFGVFLMAYGIVTIVGMQIPMIGVFSWMIAWAFGLLSLIFLVIAIVLTVK